MLREFDARIEMIWRISDQNNFTFIAHQKTNKVQHRANHILREFRDLTIHTFPTSSLLQLAASRGTRLTGEHRHQKLHYITVLQCPRQPVPSQRSDIHHLSSNKTQGEPRAHPIPRISAANIKHCMHAHVHDDQDGDFDNDIAMTMTMTVRSMKTQNIPQQSLPFRSNSEKSVPIPDAVAHLLARESFTSEHRCFFYIFRNQI